MLRVGLTFGCSAWINLVRTARFLNHVVSGTHTMRWLYFDPSDPEEAALHAAVIGKIDTWWNQFASKTDDLCDLFAQRSQWDLPAWMLSTLNPIDAELMWEYGGALSGSGHRLVITPEAATHLRPMVATILERAPKLAGWEFYSYRLPEDVAMAEQMVASRSGGDLSGTLVTAVIGQHNRVDLTYHDARTRRLDDKQAFNNAFVATETLVGEELMDKWVGTISVERLRKTTALDNILGRARRSGPGLLPLDRLKPTVDALIASMQDQLPDKPYYAFQPALDSSDHTQGFVMKLEPRQAGDYPGRLDLFVAVGTNQGLWRARHQDAHFYSERYSRHCERFCYLKLDGSEGLDEEKFSDRASIEDALNEALVPECAGCVIGGGTGLRYSYIDLALANVDSAVPLIQSRLRAGNITRRAWLLFFDATLSHEWIGMYDDGPAPP